MEPARETSPQKDSFGEKALEFCHRQSEKAITWAFGEDVNKPFTDKKISRPELYLGLVITSALIAGTLAKANLAPLGPMNTDLANTIALISAAKAGGVGLAAGIGIDVMSGIGKMSKRVAEKLHQVGDKVFKKDKPDEETE